MHTDVCVPPHSCTHTHSTNTHIHTHSTNTHTYTYSTNIHTQSVCTSCTPQALHLFPKPFTTKRCWKTTSTWVCAVACLQLVSVKGCLFLHHATVSNVPGMLPTAELYSIHNDIHKDNHMMNCHCTMTLYIMTCIMTIILCIIIIRYNIYNYILSPYYLSSLNDDRLYNKRSVILLDRHKMLSYCYCVVPLSCRVH